MGDWRDWVNKNASLLPGQSILHPDQKLPGIHEDVLDRVAIPFGMAARLIKEGQSVALGIDLFGTSERRHLAYFLHCLHLEACQGLITGKWVAAVRRMQTRHLMVWGPNREWEICLQEAASQLHPLHFKKVAKEILKREPDRLRTMLISRRHRTTSAMEELSSIVTPFCIIIDATPWGYRKEFGVDWAILGTYFPDIPKFVIFHRSDLHTRQEIAAYPLHQIVWRNEDEERISPPINMLISPDPVMNHYLGESSQCLFTAAQERKTKDREILRLGRSLVAQLSDLASPFDLYQNTLAGQQGVVTYMQKTPLARLRALEKTKADYGAGSALKAHLLDQLTSLNQKLEQGEPGKAALVKSEIDRAIANNKSILVIVRSDNDAKVLMRYVGENGDHESLVSEQFQCMSVNKKWPVSMWEVPFDEVLITCTLWYADLWLLDIPNTKINWTCYPYEVPLRQAIFKSLYKKALALSQPDGDKLAIVNYQWTNKRYLKDWTTVHNDTPDCPTQELRMYQGRYTFEQQDAKVRFEWDDDAAFERMIEFEETIGGQSAAPKVDIEAGQYTVITWEEDDQPLVVTSRTKLKIINQRDDSIEECYGASLEPGSQVVLMRNDTEVVADIFNAISDQLSADMSLELMLRKIGLWDQLIDRLNEQHSVSAIKAELARDGVTISETQVRNWLNHRHYGPKEIDTLKAVAKLCGNKSAVARSSKVFAAMQEYRKWRRALGKFIKKAIHENYQCKSLDVDGFVIHPDVLEELLVLRTVKTITCSEGTSGMSGTEIGLSA